MARRGLIAVLFDVKVTLEGFDRRTDADAGRVLATDVSYGVALEGAGNGSVSVQPFDINTHPTTHADPVTTRSTTSNDPLVIKWDGFGLALPFVALALVGLLARRRQ